MVYPETAEGFMVHDTKNWSTFKKDEFQLKPFGDRDVDVAVDCCGVCGSDVHTITGGWGEIPLPLCVGHEVIGRAIRVGKNVTTVKVGDRVGVGAQVAADLTCDLCKEDQENYCPNQVDAYGAKYPEFPDGPYSQGGYSSHMRAHEYFVFKIPDELKSEIAAPMLCAGITVYSPLVRLGCGPGKRVGVVGIGGLGHFAILFAKALGAEVVAFSHSPSKKDDALALGASDFIATGGSDDWHKPFAYKFDYILNTSNMVHKMDLSAYFSMLKIMGKFHNVGMPEEPLKLMLQDFVGTGCYIGTSHIGNRPEMIAMLELAAKQDIKSWVETVDISEEGCKKVVENVKNGKVRYRFTLVNYDNVFGKRG